MACPHCGGTERRAISPGFWECTSLLYGQIPTGLHPSGQFGPAFQPVAQPCGRRYQEGAPGGAGTLCQTCTIFAIGICADCRSPQCGNCGLHYQGAFLCALCRQIRVQAEQALAREAEAETRRQTAAAQAAAARMVVARRTWLRTVGKSLDAAQVRRTHNEGWAIGPAIEEWVTVHVDSYRGYSHTTWEESQLIVTPTGELLECKRSKPKQTTWRWQKKWTSPVTHNFHDITEMGAYIRTQYGVSAPELGPTS